MSRWDELGDGVYRRRYASLDLNVGLIVGERGVVVVDTRATRLEAEELRGDIAHISDRPVIFVVDTHWHWDHTFGNASFPEATIWSHLDCRRMLADHEARARSDAKRWLADRPQDIDATEVRLPDQVFGDRETLDLGDRTIEMRFLGRGHTEGDIVVIAADAGVVFAGDLLEEGAPPQFGDAYPEEWPGTVERLHALGHPVTVPGHGDVMGPEQVVGQIGELGLVAAIVAEARLAGAAVDEFDVRHAPYPEATIRQALRRGLSVTS